MNMCIVILAFCISVWCMGYYFRNHKPVVSHYWYNT